MPTAPRPARSHHRPRPGAQETAVSIRGLLVRFGETTAVDAVDLDIGLGEVFGLLGPNGAGKTTTMRVVTTLLPATEGSVSVFGVDVAERPMEVRRLLGFVPQQLSADAALTGRENVALFARLFGVPRHRRRALVSETLDAMGLAGAADRVVSTYSGGMIRRLELAQALVNRPRLLVLDEPTIGLDPIARAAVWGRIAELQAGTGMTVLLTTHYLEEAAQLCDRVALMHHGRVRAIGSPADLEAALGPDTTLEDVFRHYTADLGDAEGEMRQVRQARRTAGRLG